MIGGGQLQSQGWHAAPSGQTGQLQVHASLGMAKQTPAGQG